MSRIIVLILFIAMISCSKTETNETTIPDCIEKKIEAFKKNIVCDQSQVKLYTFQKKSVYVFENENCCCDFTSEVVDTDCKILGFLGGIIGNYKINGVDFSEATFVKVIWKK